MLLSGFGCDLSCAIPPAEGSPSCCDKKFNEEATESILELGVNVGEMYLHSEIMKWDYKLLFSLTFSLLWAVHICTGYLLIL